MKWKVFSEDVSGFASLSEDGREVATNRTRAAGCIQYVMDTNVFWFLLNPSDLEDEQLAGRDEVKYFGERFAASNIRRCLHDVIEKDEKVIMTKSHFLEHEVAIKSDLQVDYETVKTNFESVFDNVRNEIQQKKLKNADAAEHIVRRLSEEFQDDYKILSDLVSGRLADQAEALSLVETLSASTLDEEKFSELSEFLYALLAGGAGRSNFSVRNDIDSVRSIISENLKRSKSERREDVVLLTLDQRLLETCRLATSLRLPLSEYLYVENCASFWLWKRTKNSAAESAWSAVADDFLSKSGSILRAIEVDSSGAFDPDGFVVFDYEMFQQAHNTISISKPTEAKMRVQQSLARVLDNLKLMHEVSDQVHHEKLLGALSEFFAEVNRLLPSVQLAVSSAQIYENVLKERLEKCGTDKEQFMSALGADIEDHARRSMAILGASTILAPNRPIAALSEFEKYAKEKKQFHRLPIPIRSEVSEVAKVSRLIANDTDWEAKYAELVKIGSLSGPNADLVTASLAIGAGQWKRAEAICVDSTFHRTFAPKDEDTAFELHLLLAAIYRIFETNSYRLDLAEQKHAILRKNFSSSSERHKLLRLTSEELAVRANRVLYDAFTSESTSSILLGDKKPEVLELILELSEHVREVEKSELDPEIKEKLVANAGVNMTTVYFCSGRHRPKISKDELNAMGYCVKVSLERLISDARVSYFEEIVALFAFKDLSIVLGNSHGSMDQLKLRRENKCEYLEILDELNLFERWILLKFLG
jgi:hypothetical protein